MAAASNVYQKSWDELQKEIQALKEKLTHFDCKATDVLPEIDKHENALLEKKDGIEIFLRELKEYDNQNSIKSLPLTSSQTTNQWLKYTIATVSLGFMTSTQDDAAKAKIIANQTLALYTSENDPSHSKAGSYTLAMLEEIKKVEHGIRNCGITGGRILTAIINLYKNYHFPAALQGDKQFLLQTDNEFNKKLQEKRQNSFFPKVTVAFKY